MSSLTRCQVQDVIFFTYFLSYIRTITCFLLFFMSKILQSTFSSQSFTCIYIPKAHRSIANYLLSVMTANCIISLTCSECLKCKGSHLLLRCPRQTASTERKECYHTVHLRSDFPIKLKNCLFCSTVLPLPICQRDTINTIDNSTGFNPAHKSVTDTPEPLSKF